MAEELILYIHGKGGSAAESERYRPLFPGCTVEGLDYRTFTPWETGGEIRRAVEERAAAYGRITLIANSIGAFFSMNAGVDALIRRAFFISPIVDMERLIRDMMLWANVSEAELAERGVVPTAILYGRNDNLTAYETVAAFAKAHRASLTVMEDGEHWFRTDEQLHFLDDWIASKREVF